MKLVHGNVVRIKFATNKVVEAGEEFRYDYGFKIAPWKKVKAEELKKLEEPGGKQVDDTTKLKKKSKRQKLNEVEEVEKLVLGETNADQQSPSQVQFTLQLLKS